MKVIILKKIYSLKLLFFIIAFLNCNLAFSASHCAISVNRIAEKTKKISHRVNVGKNQLIKDYDYLVNIDGLTVRKQCSKACFHEASTNMAEIFLRTRLPELKEYRMSIFHNYMDLYLYKMKQKIGLKPLDITNFGYLDSSLETLKQSGMKFYNNIIDDYKEIEKNFKRIEQFIDDNKSSPSLVKDVEEEAKKIISDYENKNGTPDYMVSPEEISSLYGDEYRIIKENVKSSNMGAYQNIKAEDERLGVKRLHITSIKEEIIASLKKGNPVGLGMRTNADSNNPIYQISGIRRFFPGLGGGHAVTIVGVKLDKKQKIESFLILDTAGEITRDHGFIHMLPSYFDKAIENIYLINN